MWYLQLQSLETLTLIIAHYEVSLICLEWWIRHFVKFIKRDLISKFNKYFKMLWSLSSICFPHPNMSYGVYVYVF